MCQRFREAIEVRDAAQKLRDDGQTPELIRIDLEFANRFRTMIRRHETEFRNLLTHLKSVIGALKHRADGRKLTAQAVLNKKNAFNATLIIESVSQPQVSPTARNKVIQAYSPRSRSSATSPRSGSSAAARPPSQGSPP
jgi:hypothetical protein